MIFDSKQSVYLQIAEQIKRNINLGIISDGEKLPSCRELAIKTGINPNTVQRAYSALEEEGVIYAIPKKGVYARAPSTDEGARRQCREAVSSFKASGLSKEEIIKIVEEVYGDD